MEMDKGRVQWKFYISITVIRPLMQQSHLFYEEEMLLFWFKSL